MSKIYIGIDNGISGSIGIVGDGIEPKFYLTPIFKQQDYTKAKKNISRLDVFSFRSLFSGYSKDSMVFIMERPLINSKMFNASICASRCFESELVQIEMLGCKHYFIDSKEWQRFMLPEGIVGTPLLKKASLDIGMRLFPNVDVCKHKDMDGMLIAEYARRKNL